MRSTDDVIALKGAFRDHGYGAYEYQSDSNGDSDDDDDGFSNASIVLWRSTNEIVGYGRTLSESYSFDGYIYQMETNLSVDGGCYAPTQHVATKHLNVLHPKSQTLTLALKWETNDLSMNVPIKIGTGLNLTLTYASHPDLNGNAGNSAEFNTTRTGGATGLVRSNANATPNVSNVSDVGHGGAGAGAADRTRKRMPTVAYVSSLLGGVVGVLLLWLAVAAIKKRAVARDANEMAAAASADEHNKANADADDDCSDDNAYSDASSDRTRDDGSDLDTSSSDWPGSDCDDGPLLPFTNVTTFTNLAFVPQVTVATGVANVAKSKA